MAKMKNPMSLFKGKDDYREEMNEAKAIKSGKISPKEYAMGEKKEDSAKMKKKFAAGGSVRGTGCATKGKKFSGVF
jgi:hypothetical protein